MTCCTTTSPDEAPTRAGPWVRILVAAFLAFNSMVAALAVNLSEVSLAERRWLHVGLFVATAIVAALVGGPLVRRTAEALRRGKVTVEALFIAGMAGAFAYSLYHAVVGSGAVYFEIVSILLVIYALGTQIKQQVQSRVLASTQAFSPAAATCQTLTCCGKLVEKPVSAVNVGDSVRVFPGQVIPVDGVILEGASFVRQSALTGEPAAVPRKAGDAVFAATHALDGTLTLRATARGDDRRIDHIVRAVEQARGRRSHLERQADRLAAWFFPVVATASAGTFAGWAWFGTYEAAFLNAMAVLLIACPCALGFATPVGIWSALARLGRRGFVVRDAGAVEHMAAVDTVLFDKTGTLTDAEAGDVTLHVLHGQDEHRVRAMVAAAEAASDHPVARQLRALVPADGTSGWSAVAAEAIPGVGFRANVRDGAGAVCEVMIVNAATRAADGASDASAEREEELDVLMNGHLVARVVVDERPLAGRADAFAELQAMGLDVRVLSGDTGERIERLRGKRGTSPLASGRAVCVEGGLTPQEKLDRVNALKAEGRRVLFVGDGINDAAAMAAADVGIATAEGSALAGETAQIVWAGLADGPRDVRAIVQAISVCRQTVATLRGNLRIAAAYNAVGMSVAAAGWLHPVFAVVVMLASSLLVTLRAGGLQDDAPGEGLYRDGPVAGGVAGVSPPAVRAPALASAGASSGEM